MNVYFLRMLILLAFMSISGLIKGQDEIFLLNGKRFVGHAIDTTGLKVLFETKKSNNKSKIRDFYKEDVFSINGSDYEHIFYAPSEFFDGDYSKENMKLIVSGKRDARYGFKTKWVIPTGIVVGAASALLLEGSVFVLLVPIVYTGIVQIPVVKIQKNSITSPDFIGNDFYKQGYNKTARSKRTKQALLSSISGVIAGLLVYELSK